jgi:hypothetical protein
MGPREEDNSILLLGAVTLICGAIAFVPWLFEPTSAGATTAPAAVTRTVIKDDHVRVIVPFTPNTTPNLR